MKTFALILALLRGCVACPAADITIVWDRNPEPNIAGYWVHQGSLPGVYDFATNVGNVTLAKMPAREGTNYFAVTAQDTDGLESGLSDEVSWAAPQYPLLNIVGWQAVKVGTPATNCLMVVLRHRLEIGGPVMFLTGVVAVGKSAFLDPWLAVPTNALPPPAKSMVIADRTRVSITPPAPAPAPAKKFLPAKPNKGGHL